MNSVLKNTFCIKPDEQVQPLPDIDTIADYAFEGCQLTSFFNNDTTFNTVQIINHHAFDGALFSGIPSKNGFKIVGNIVFGVDDNAEEVEFPEDIKCVLPTDIDYKNVKRAVIRNIKNVNGINKMPETIVIADTNPLLGDASIHDTFVVLRYMYIPNMLFFENSVSAITIVSGIL